ncbi:hypothetical protein SSX86_028210 [Deinandra increscens subsp. villosa]|uniref:Uncharacterized protein n=1 Tax=Deinandra increscens subsp. villosa TaxID=3103831 RepID=A0AAP0GJ39_9ASTR
METRRTSDELGEIKKGPWKTEEDEVLIKHVKKCGARDWSSIRSKGLLQRTGKSCRLRWVNKLRPNLKNGVKFSAEEERIVIELQGQFGNKWARIATFLPGRTDNDVKNFWSSRQKRLARVLQSSPPPSQPPQKSQKTLRESPAIHKVPPFEAPKLSSSTDGESSVTSPKTLSSSSSYWYQFEYTAFPKEENSCNQPPHPPSLQDFHHVPPPPPPPPFDTQDIFNQLADPNFYAVFGQGGTSDMLNFPYVLPGGDQGESGGSCGRDESNDAVIMEPNTFMDDFPMDMFDQIEPLPSPSEW